MRAHARDGVDTTTMATEAGMVTAAGVLIAAGAATAAGAKTTAWGTAAGDMAMAGMW